MLPQACDSTTLRGRFEEEKFNLSNAGEITESVDVVLSKSSWNNQKQHGGVKVAKDDELVKYMSRLPSYLEKGKNPQEKVLSVGVLDWGRLEQWQLSHKKVEQISSVSSSSGSNVSSSFSTDESSADSGRGCSASPARQRARRLSLQFDMDGVKAFKLSVQKSQFFNAEGDCIGENKSDPAMKLDQFTGKDTSKKIKSDCVTSDGVKSEVNIVRRDGKPMKKLDKSREGNLDNVGRELSGARVDGGSLSQRKSTGIADAITKEISHERSRPVQLSAKIGCTPKSRNIEEKVASIKPQESLVAPEKARSTSPFRRLSLNIGKTSKTSTAKDSSAVVPQLSSEHASAKCDPESTDADKTNAASKGKTSPLRRLFDPLWKPKLAKCSDVSEIVQKRSISTERASRSSSHGRRHASTTIVSSEKKTGSSTVQALFRLQVKNGLPLFTFAVDNENDILAATMKMFSASSKDDHDCIFTFFSIQEGKKNGRWINQGGKRKGQDCIPNIVAQMKVYSSDISHLPGQNSIDQFRIREYALLGLNLKQTNQQTSDFQQSDELAAIVMKLPRRIAKRDGNQTDEHLVLQNPEVKFDSHFVKNSQSIDTTVILPSGVHSLPSKGGPSSLIQRWKTGGSCDCGGWDLGCKLKILTSRNQNQLSSTKTSSSVDQFELFFEGGLQENPRFFNMTCFKDGSYSVEFVSSLSPMQAFSICLSVWDSRRLNESVTSFVDTTDGEVPARYASFPPLSPAGRV